MNREESIMVMTLCIAITFLVMMVASICLALTGEEITYESECKLNNNMVIKDSTCIYTENSNDEEMLNTIIVGFIVVISCTFIGFIGDKD